MSFSRFQHPALTISRHTRPSASLERYGLIRNFFLRQVRTPTSSAIALPTISITLNRHLVAKQNTFHAGRLFHTTSPTRDEDKSKHPSDPEKPPDPPKEDAKTGQVADQRSLENYSRFFRQLALSLPHLSRPTRDDFLNAATGFWSRMRVRFKWLTIRSFRRYNADDISAFVTWFLMSQTVWLLVGTTTFFSVVFATINSLSLQEYVAKAISDYLTSETGITIVFESAIVPKWKDSRISFKNVFITRRPSSVPRVRPLNDLAYDIALGYDVSNHPANYGLLEEEDPLPTIIESTDEDTNYTMFDLTIDSIDVTLSLARWLDGKGVVTDAVVKGVRGVLDRRFVFWDPENPWDPAAFRHKGQQGDFELESLQLEDVLVTVYQPGGFRPYTASIFRADMKTFRKQWMFYDFLCADNVVGQFDNCLFSLHKPQSIGRTTRQEQDNKDGQYSRMSRFRIDGVNIDHIQQMTTSEGPISWITSGKLDAVLDIQFPRDTSLLGDDPLAAIIDAIAERIPGQKQLAKPPLSAPSDRDEPMGDGRDGEGGGGGGEGGGEMRKKVVVDIDLRFRDLKAAVPIWTNDLSYTSNALIRPIVAFMNANRTLIPIHCKVVKDLSEFDGAWTMWETGLMDAIGDKVYEAMAYHVTQANFNRRIKAVSAWSLQRTAQAVLAALKTMTNPVTEQLRELYDDPGVYQWNAWFPGVGGVGIGVGAG